MLATLRGKTGPVSRRSSIHLHMSEFRSKVTKSWASYLMRKANADNISIS